MSERRNSVCLDCKCMRECLKLPDGWVCYECITARLAKLQAVVAQIAESKAALSGSIPCYEAWMEHSSQRQWELYRWRVEELERERARLAEAEALLRDFGKAELALAESEDGLGCDTLINEHVRTYEAIKREAVRLAKEMCGAT